MNISHKILLVFILLTLTNSLQDCIISTNIPGADIADDAREFPNPFEWYTNPSHPGVTLPGPESLKKCNWKLGKNFIWTEKENTCILNGQGYPLENEARCGNELYRENKEKFVLTYNAFRDHAYTKAIATPLPDGSTAYITELNFQGKKIQAAMSVGHGMLDGLCGDCFVIKNEDKYVFHLQTGVRAWSLEITGGASTWIASDNYGGTCYVPQVEKVSCDLAGLFTA